MTTKYFGFNTLAGAKRSTTGVVDGDSTAGRFDSTYVATAIKIPTATDTLNVSQPFADGSTSLAGTVYLRFDSYQTNFNGTNAICLVLNGAANAYRVLAGATALQVQYWNSGTSAWVNWGAATPAITLNINITYMLKLAINSAFELYAAGTLVASSSTVPTNGAAAVTEFRFATTNNSGAAGFFSQIMMADYDIRDAHLMSKLANGEGTYTNGTGVYTDINETVLDDSNAISLPAVGNKHTFTKAAITVPGGLQIGGMVVNIRGRVSGGVVADGKALIRSSATDSASASKGFTAGYEPRAQIADNDPATGTRWTQTGFNSAEFGLQAA